MKPVDFPGSNVTYAAKQPEYLPLPALRTPEGQVTSCWGLTWRERLTVLLRGHLFVSVLTFNYSLQPMRLTVSREEALHGK